MTRIKDDDIEFIWAHMVEEASLKTMPRRSIVTPKGLNRGSQHTNNKKGQRTTLLSSLKGILVVGEGRGLAT